MKVLYTAARTEMRIARLFYHNPADMNVWLQPQATVHKKDGTQIAGASHIADNPAENVAEEVQATSGPCRLPGGRLTTICLGTEGLLETGVQSRAAQCIVLASQ